jgi:small subunit ribosomal protein S19
MGRSLKKGPYVDPNVWDRVESLSKSRSKEPIKTWARRCDIVPEFVGHTFMVHNGNKFLRVYVTEDMVGHKLGEFAPTRLFRAHSTRKVEEAPAEGAAPAAGKKK